MDSVAVEPARASGESIEHALSVSYSVVDYESAEYVFDFGTVGLAYHLWIAPGFELGAGGRFGFGESLTGGLAGEGFATLALVPHFRTLTDETGLTASWRPAAGFEVGYSSAERQFTEKLAPESIARRDSQAGPVYLEFLARPLRFRFSDFNVTAMGLGFGAPFSDPGRKLRVQIDVLQIGYVF